MCKWYCTSSGPSTNLCCLHCGVHYCGACLRGDAGKMESLIKCAGCGKKPGVKTNGHRNSWTAVCNAPCNERGGPRYDMDDGAANSAFTSGLRAAGAQETDEAAGRRSRADSTQLRGPERFFYDRSTYTGTHTNGGPEHVAKGAGSKPDACWKRPSAELDDLARVTLLSNQAGAPRPGSPSCLPDVNVKSPRPTGQRPSSKGPSARPASRGAGSRMVGPERFFYDRSTYTGTHTRGGPSSVAKGGGSSFDQSWKRPV
eukprot:symbB.v1.2.031884.t1/scaffold3750.1/size50945/3